MTANLTSPQKSMKKKYDVDAVEHNFKPEQKVLPLLPVPGDQLTSRFFGPYVIQKTLRVILITWWLLQIQNRLKLLVHLPLFSCSQNADSTCILTAVKPRPPQLKATVSPWSYEEPVTP